MNLSIAQKQAVEYLDGPQIILAGAGSGKTRVIVAKAQYLIEKGYAPDSLYIITYSSKTQAELEERMAVLGDKMPSIKTFHSLGIDMISEFGHLLKLPSEPAKLDDHALYICLRRAIAELTESDLLDTNQTERVYRELDSFISRAKDELLTPDEIIDRAEKELTNTPVGDDDDIVLHKDRWIKVIEAGKIYRSYEKIKSSYGPKGGGIDYGDMIVLMHRLLTRERVVSAAIHKRCRYILVDEFQDTNFAQVEILRLMAGSNCGVTVVGDDDQAIYRFRGASFASFRLFQKLFAGYKIIRLEDNYRSQANIVRAAQTLIEADPDARFDSGKKMNAIERAGAEVVVRKCPDEYSESLAVAGLIERLLADPEYQKPASIAVLVRARKHKDLLIRILERKRIKYTYDKKSSELVSEPGKLLMSLYEFTCDISRVDLLPGILNHFIPNLRPEIERDINFRLSRESGDPLLLLRNINDELGEQSPSGLTEAIDLLAGLRQSVAETPPLQHLEKIAIEAGLMKDMVHDGRISNRDASKEMASILRAAERFQLENPHATHAAFLEYLEWQAGWSNDDNGVENEKEAVIIQTVHGSKGLEYPVVIMISLTNRRFPTQKQHSILEFPPELYKEELPSGDFRIQEERRLFYVAMTRARKMLYMYGMEKKGTKISQFISELERSPIFKQVGVIEKIEPETEEAIPGIGPDSVTAGIRSVIIPTSGQLDDVIARGLRELWKKHGSDANMSDEFEKLKIEFLERVEKSVALLRAYLSNDNYQPPPPPWRYKVDIVSYTDLQAFGDCPLKFYYRKILRMPSPSGPQQTLGSVMHSILEEAGKILKDGKPLVLDDLGALFEKHWNSAYFSDPDRKERLRQRGHELLQSFMTLQLERTGKPTELERKFNIPLMPEMGNETPKLVGRIDRIDRTSAGLEVVDYKTGKESSHEHKGDLQLPIYSLACKSEFGEYASRLLYMFLADTKIHDASYGPEDLDKVRIEILEIIEQINNSDFIATPGHICNSCSYARICPAKAE
jgi:DNA helicase II / ATP-dependent DNA helicase PcrA